MLHCHSFAVDRASYSLVMLNMPLSQYESILQALCTVKVCAYYGMVKFEGQKTTEKNKDSKQD